MSEQQQQGRKAFLKMGSFPPSLGGGKMEQQLLFFPLDYCPSLGRYIGKEKEECDWHYKVYRCKMPIILYSFKFVFLTPSAFLFPFLFFFPPSFSSPLLLPHVRPPSLLL